MAPFLRPSTWTQALLGGALCLCVLSVLLSPVCCSRGPPNWRFTTSEVVIPRKVPQRRGGSNMPDEITYSMRFRGQRHVIHMKLKKNMIPENLPVFTTNDQGAEQEEYPFIPRDCYFYSYLEGVPGSLATLDTCNGGLKGMIQVDDFTYEIKPLASSPKFEHVVSLLVVEEKSRKSRKCRHDEDVAEVSEYPEEMKFAGSARAAPVYLWRVHRKNLRLHYVVTNAVYKRTSNFSKTAEMVLIMNSIVDSIYQPTGMGIFVRAICIWYQHDSYNVYRFRRDPWALTSNFGMWKVPFHRVIEHSISILMTGHRVGNRDYLSNSGGLCNPNWGVMYLYIHFHHFLTTTVLAHGIGHFFKMQHDLPGCVCFRRSSCVMTEFPTLQDMLSNCSQKQIHVWVHGWDPCLSEERVPYNNFKYVVRRCGDKTVDEKEQCDCGSLKDCINNKCCTTTCEYTEDSTCDVGGCCKDCVFAPSGTRCRDKLGVCDLPEYCNGLSNDCPDNVYIMDGTPCSAGAVCMRGNCSDRDLQCQALFGYQVKDGSPACYKELNRKGDRFGNCGVKKLRGGSNTIPCQDDDIFCGLLHCEGVTRIPGGGQHATFHHIKVKDVKEQQCFGYDVHHGLDIPFVGLVVDGATCGPGKYCRRQSCVFHQTLHYKCNISSCSFRGVCNNKGNCHCVQGWQPPTCEQRGTGGSVNSGPPPIMEKMLEVTLNVTINKILLVLITRLFLILASLLFGGITRAVILIDKEAGQQPSGQVPGGKAPGEKAPDGKAPGGKAPGEKAPGGKAPGGKAPSGKAPRGK
ncbi:disintegrin and metalloproteinase domain-containing protein 20-like [Psammomys obesus]|uniref:disintegrin and metalloproteinase domain-containing protein 20-like n=1 Tax=Psammomys obesus TaxID=48139 RepID=UPI002452B70A|nr:disintegrin and metalloproteinase domain-containing protein 20-like [Psammomys obesus]